MSKRFEWLEKVILDGESATTRKKNIALMFNKPGVFPGFEDVVSAHIQLPLKTVRLLQENDHDHILITTLVPENQVLPNIFCDINAKSICFVPDINRQGSRSAALEGQVSGIIFGKLFSHLRAVRKAFKENDIRILHVFGTRKFALLAILYKILSPNIKLIWTTENRYKKSSRLINYIIYKSVHTILTTTEYVRSTLAFHGKVKLARPGIAREFAIDTEAVKRRVLFWRDPSMENGADIALEVFKKLALEFEEIIFTFAVRPHWAAVVSKNDFKEHNLEYFEFPYGNEVTIDHLLSESICVLFPFRELSTNPQLAVIETLNAGIPVICSSVESNQEILENVGLDYGLDSCVEDYEERLRAVLNIFLRNSALENSRISNLKKYYNWGQYLATTMEAYH